MLARLLAVLVLVVALAPAAEASITKWTVTNPNADGTYSIREAALTLRGTAADTTISCTGADGGGKLRSATVTMPEIGWFRATEYRGCTNADGTPVRVSQIVPWSLFAATYDPAGGRTGGNVLSGSYELEVNRPGCRYFVSDVDGWRIAGFAYVNASSRLTIGTDSLRVMAPEGCGGAIREGHALTFEGSYRLTPAITIVGS